MKLPVAALLLLLPVGAALAAPSAVSVTYPGGVLNWSVRSGDTILTVARMHQPPVTVRLRRDGTVPRHGTPTGIEVIGTIDDSLLILADQYASKREGLARCGAGTERFLRVIALSPGKGVERFKGKLDSCLDNVELASPGLEWNAADHTLQVHWLSAPGQAGVAKDTTLRISREAVTE